MFLNDQQIKERCMLQLQPGYDASLEDLNFFQPMLDPFHPEQVTHAGSTKLISFGLSSVGYDIRLDYRIKMFQPSQFTKVIDPKRFDDKLITEFEVSHDGYFDIPPHGYVLGNSMELFTMPDDVSAICMTKSTYARCGLLCNTTPIEPGWIGYLTLELANLTDLPMRVYAGEGIAQILFSKSERPNVTYADRKGKYQNQGAEPVTPRMK